MILLLLQSAWAEDGDPSEPADVAMTEAYDAGRRIEAQRLAEERLAVDPDSFVAHYVRGMVLYNEVGDLSRARADLERAEEIWTETLADAPDHPWKIHALLLNGLADVSGAMDDREGELAWLDVHDAAYDPDRVAEHAWPLMKLRRYDDARGWAERGIASDDDWQVLIGRTALCAISAEEGDRDGAYTACHDADTLAPDTFDRTVNRMNAANASQAVLKFDEGEQLLRAAGASQGGATVNPWIEVVWLSLAQARGVEALDAARRMQAWRAALPASARDQERAALDTALAAVFYAAGDGAQAQSTIERALTWPDRFGGNSSSADQARGANLLLRLVTRRLQRRATYEDAQAGSFLGRLWSGFLFHLPEPDDFRDRAGITATLTDARRLRRTLTMYSDGGLLLPAWLVGELVPVIGPGVVEAEVARIREDPRQALLAPYQEALLAECAWRRGDRTEAVRLAEAAGKALPSAERLLRARLAAVRADASDGAAALAAWQEAIDLDPGVARRMGLALPAEVEGGGGEVADAVVELLRRSPSLERAPGAFRVAVSGGPTVEVCLWSPSGARIACSRTSWPKPPEEGATVSTDEYALAAVRDFHASAFGLPMGASRGELGGLDGTNVVATSKLREQMKGLLEGLDP